ncbi:trans-Golgi network integral membrane protein 2 [Anolis sagrei]|uniref:trans-Golgi network integral membrane protein 2 n=1 Tax=Anolis sagrei TaxID=38937 RepID=UPI003522A408
MASARRCLLLLFLLFQVAAFGASAPLEPGGGEAAAGGGGGTGGGAEEAEAEEAAKEGPVLTSHDESRTSPSGETSKTDQTDSKESQKSIKPKNREQIVPSSHVQNPELSRHQESGISQNNAKPPQADSHVTPAADSNQSHTSELDSVAQKPGHKAEEGDDLSNKGPPDVPDSKKTDSKDVNEIPKGLQPDVPVPDPLSKKSDSKDGKETPQNLPPDASVPDSSSKKSDPKEDQETPKSLPPDAFVPDSGSKKSDPKVDKKTLENVQPDVPDSLSKKTDSSEVKDTQNLPLPVEDNKSAAAEPEAPPLKEDQNEDNQNGILTKFKPPQPGETEPEFTPEKSVQDGKLPTAVENNLPDTSVSKDEDDEEDGLEEDDMAGDDKVGEEIAGASQPEKEEAKTSPAGPAPKNGSENSHFFAYLVTTAIVVAALYIAYHNKRKIIAFALEGKKSKVIRRPKSSDYQRLDQKI